jgi:predicted membrane-bound mannosyltransferase
MGKKARRSASQAVSTGPGTRDASTAHAWTERDRRYWPAVAAVFVVAFLLRVFYLGVMTSSAAGWTGVGPLRGGPTFMHDEAIYSIFSHNFHEYNFDPVYHGPTLYHLIKFYFLVSRAFGMALPDGDNDFSARMVSVTMGMLAMWLVVGPGRRWMGARGALWCAAVLAISPMMVTYQRRILFDAFVMTLTLGSVLCFQSAISIKPGTWRWRGAWIGLVALTTLFLATKANSFFVIAMLGSFWVLTRVRNLLPRDFLVKLPKDFPLIVFLFLVSATIVLAERDGNILGLMKNGSVLLKERILQGVGVVCCALLWEWLRRPTPEQRPVKRKSAPVVVAAALPAVAEGVPAPAPAPRPSPILWPQPELLTVVLSVLAFAFLYAFFFGHGFYWYKNPLHIYHDHWPEIRDAMKKMLDYWGGQQKLPRLPGRHDYYLPLMAAYELPIMVAALCGIFRAGRRRTRFTDLLLWWCFSSFTLYSIANEKVPWLATHFELPFILLAGWWLGQVRFAQAAARYAFAAAVLLGSAYLLRNVVATNYDRALDHKEPMFYAFTSESFQDTYFKAIEVAQQQKREGDIWVYNAWPASWYMRHADVEFPGSGILYDETFPKTEKPFRLVVCQEPDFEKEKDGKFKGFHKWTVDPVSGQVVRDAGGENPYILLWPRISWTSLRLDKWVHWFITREAALPEGDPWWNDHPEANKDEAFLTEWSHIPVVVATPD